MSWGAVAGAVIGAGSAYLGKEEQKKGIRKAEKRQQAEDAAARAREEGIYADTEAFRELSREAIPFIREDVLAAEPGGSALYQRALSGGIEDIQSQLAGYGLADSSVAGKAIGEFTGELSARDAQNIRQARLGLARGGTTGIPETLSAGGRTTGAAANLSNLAIQRGESQAGLYGNLANIATAGIGAYQQQRGFKEQQNIYGSQFSGRRGQYLTDQPSLTIDPEYR